LNEKWIDVFTSKEFKLLCFLKSKQIATLDGERILHSQEDIAKEFGVSIATINKFMTSLRKTGCLEKYKQKSGYRLTSKGEYLIKHIEKISEYNGGKDNG